MYEYKFVKIDVTNGFIKASPKDDYHEVIEKHSKEGWRLVQIFAPSIKSHGIAGYYEIIFERKI